MKPVNFSDFEKIVVMHVVKPLVVQKVKKETEKKHKRNRMSYDGYSR